MNNLKPLNLKQEFQTEIRRGRIKNLVIYEVSESELNALEQGAPNSILLNLSIFFLSVAIAFTIAIFNVNFPSSKVFYYFLIAAIVGWSAGIVLIIFWVKNYYSIKSVVKTIRNRVSPMGEAKNEEIYSKYKNIKFKLLSARYGTDKYSIDVYGRVLPMVSENGLNITASNNIAGDPHKGVIKKLSISYICCGQVREAEIVENDSITLP